MRPIDKVLTEILKCVPANAVVSGGKLSKYIGNRILKDAMREDFDKIIKDSAFAPPEDQLRFWERASDIISAYLGKPDTNWKMKIARLFADVICYRCGKNKPCKCYD